MPTAAPLHSPTGHGYSVQGLKAIADRWGYACEPLVPADDRLIAEGTLSTLDLSCGVRFCATDLVATYDHERVAVVGRSLMIILMLDGDPAPYRIDAGEEIAVRPGCAAVIAAADDTRLGCRYRRGVRGRSLVLHATPDEMPDDALGEHVRRRLTATTATPLAINERLRLLADEVFAASLAGPVARLLTESFALELFARGLAHEPEAIAAPRSHPRDVARILRVRDLLLAEPAVDHRMCDLARLAEMSVSSLKAKFPAVVGQPVFDFLRDQRLAHARRGLETEGWSVKEAAYRAGYAHPSNFATAYRRKFGRAPRATRTH